MKYLPEGAKNASKSALSTKSLVPSRLAPAVSSKLTFIRTSPGARSGLCQVLRQDYARALRRCVSYEDIALVLRGFQDIFPRFNSRPVDLMSLDACREVGDRCGFVFKAAPYRENQGLKLRGFYVSGSRLLKRPLVFVNSAHPPVVACSSFVHELAHHVSAGIFGPVRPGRGRYFNTDFSNQLTSRDELLADIMVSFAGYPKDLAEEIFMKRPGFRRQSRADRLPDPALSQIRKHLRKIYRFELCFNGPDKRQFLDYLAGAIHYAKLRWAVLSEYEL